jgi:hypothetical protein
MAARGASMQDRVQVYRAVVIAVLPLIGFTAAPAVGEALRTCSDVHAYCMKLCAAAQPKPPPEWTCEANRCFGFAECLTTGQYKIGTQFGHRTSSKSSYGPYEKK